MIIGRSAAMGEPCPTQSLRYRLRQGRLHRVADRRRHVLERRAQERAFGEIHAAIIRSHADRLLGDRPTEGLSDAPKAGPDTDRSGKTVFLYAGVSAVRKDARGDGAAALIDPEVDARLQ